VALPAFGFLLFTSVFLVTFFLAFMLAPRDGLYVFGCAGQFTLDPVPAKKVC
jgi:hypothetical protein